ncbi:hypothetical protein J7L60_06650 [Candidatus Bathyarchaeota archaeon]|nr:hypothetical protein [Candidatus Bathyarchaeota archaeon]
MKERRSHKDVIIIIVQNILFAEDSSIFDGIKPADNGYWISLENFKKVFPEADIIFQFHRKVRLIPKISRGGYRSS